MQSVILRNAAYFNLLDVHFVIPEFHTICFIIFSWKRRLHYNISV